MRTTNTLTPIPLAPAIPAVAKALGLIGLGGAAAAASDSDPDPIGTINTGPTTLDLVKPMLQMGVNYLAREANEAGDFLSSITGAYGDQMRRFLTISSPRPVTAEEVIQPTYVHAGWNRINGGYRYYDPNLGMNTETFIDPVIINGTYASSYDPTASLRAEPTIKTMPLVNTIQRSMPIELSSGRVVVLPSVTDYRVFDEAAGDQPAPASDVEAASVVEPVPAPAPQPTPEPEENGDGKNKGKGRGTGNRQRKKNESEFWRNFKQGRRDVVGRKPDYGYRLGKVVGWLEEHPIWTTIGAYGTYKGGKFLYDTFVGAPKSNEKGPNESDQTVNTSGVNGATTGTTGTVIYNPDQIPTDSTSTRPVAWPY